jgi:hypothetical protein
VAANTSKRTPSTPSKLELVHSDAGCAVAIWDRYVLVVWRQQVTAVGVTLCARAMTRAKQNHPGQRIAALVYMEPEVSLSGSSSTFQACAEELRRHEVDLAGYAVAYEREGFWNAAIRGRIMAINAESKTDIAFALRPTLAEACTWLKEHAADLPPIPTDALVRAVEELRAQR